MKPKRPTIHLLDCGEPLLAFHELTVRCGITLRNAKPKFMRDEELRAEIVLPSGVCIECMRKAPATNDDRREYLYGLCDAQPARDAETEEAA